MNKRILITGAGGFVGTYLIKELQKQGYSEIYGAVYKSSSDISSLLQKDHILAGDLTDPSVVASHLSESQPDIIYHLAALSVVHNSVTNALPILLGNTAISYNLFNQALTLCPKARIIAICSANEYGALAVSDIPARETAPLRPLNPYAVSKVTQEMLAVQAHVAHHQDVVILRPFNHTGPGQTHDFVIPKLASQVVAIEHETMLPSMELGSGSAVRDFTDVRDMVKAYILAAELGEPGEIYNIGTGIGITVRQVAEILQSLAKKRFAIKELPTLSRPSDVPSLVADITKFKSLTAYNPIISLEKTISDILEYERNNHGN